MTKDFCTFVDKNYLARGMALYYSLLEHCPDFTLWILCMDTESFAMLEKLKLEKIKLLKVTDVEDKRMLDVKPTRTAVEYMWMFGSQLSLFILEKTGIDMITYLDADLYFYAPMEEIYREFGDKSIMIIPHRYPDNKIHLEKISGIYNVGMLIFRNDKNALECLNWWKDRCIEWCFNRNEDGKLGDQMYLNDWPTRFKNVHVLKHLGANVAPWNIDRSTFKKNGGEIIGTDKTSGLKFLLIFYHFHGLKIYANKAGRIKFYPITLLNHDIYGQYLKAIQKAYSHIRSTVPSWNYGFAKRLDILRYIKQYVTMFFKR